MKTPRMWHVCGRKLQVLNGAGLREIILAVDGRRHVKKLIPNLMIPVLCHLQSVLHTDVQVLVLPMLCFVTEIVVVPCCSPAFFFRNWNVYSVLLYSGCV